jgi:ribosomal protein S18 acetylase RimI-like enzyme
VPGDPDLARAVAFVRDVSARCSTRTLELEGGVAFFHDRLPQVWDLNFLRLDRVRPEQTAEDLAAHADRIQAPAGLRHRQIRVADENVGARLAPVFAALGWTVSPTLYMAKRRPPARAPAVDVRELGEPAQRPFRERFLREFPEDYSDETVGQLLAAKQVLAAAVPTRWFAACVDGEPAAICELYARGTVAQIEDVGTLEAYRNRGLASAVVLRAVAEAEAVGAELVFLVADEDDWPKLLYERLGFDVIGRTFAFIRKPEAAA